MKLENIKNLSLAILVITSLTMTGYLFYKSPSYELTNETFLPPIPYTSSDKPKELYELLAPEQLVFHNAGLHSAIYPGEKNNSKLFIKLIQEAKKSNPMKIKASSELWYNVINKWTAVEMHYPYNSSNYIKQLFFNEELNDTTFKSIKNITRILVFANPKPTIWFIADQELIQAKLDIDLDDFKKHFQKINLDSKIMLTAYPLNNTDVPASLPKILYLPSKAVTVNKLTYSLEKLNIKILKSWLFRDPDVEAVRFQNKEEVYVYNDQTLNYKAKTDTLTYNDNTEGHSQKQPSIAKDLDKVNNFMHRHHGWSASNYTLEKLEPNNLSNKYSFRLMLEGKPVYLAGGLDLINISVTSEGVSKYIRSGCFLGNTPIKKEKMALPDNTKLISLMRKSKININAIANAFLGYRALTNNFKASKQITMIPVWVVISKTGAVTFIKL